MTLESSKDFSNIPILELALTLTILNYPLSSTTIYPPKFTSISSTKTTFEVTRFNFLNYITTVSDPFYHFDDNRIDSDMVESARQS